MDPGWFMLYVFMCCEAVAVAVLTMPMPSNYIRKLILDGLMSLWKKVPNIRYVSYAMLLLNAYYFYVSYSWLHAEHDKHSERYKVTLFREQRNSYITGIGLGLFFVLRRLLDLHTQLYNARIAQKALEKAAKEEGKKEQ
eukprot:TRINITY_DN2739_c0_g1_i3.p1 TRINITY_DN2739_c0_g1~~TRINITY_DN2739_c0_g1_i3.p1  ORF type:complete len:139 (+),score=40.59 TRINITY_DN2739_c0_g1_i3:68-484(+)